jgi:hypothetical protein
MNQDINKQILKKINEIEKRLEHLENAQVTSTTIKKNEKKQKTLREVVKGKKFHNGPEKIAVIVGYYEKILGSLIHKSKIKDEWINAKLDGTYKTNLLKDAEGEYIRVLSSGECDLTQTGEEFFDKFLKNKSPK